MDTLLLQLGILLFLIGLLTGLVIPRFSNPRMGLASHLEGVLNGIFLVVLGLLWRRLHLSDTWLTITFWLALYGTFANWLATFLAALWGAGTLMPIAGMGRQGSSIQEAAIRFLLVSLSLATIAVCVIVIVGLRAG
ncbi:MAG TPA: hydrogenase [Candidatus Dormibacteraeota bacterium]|jgi:hydroxylaminobenzene mutase